MLNRSLIVVATLAAAMVIGAANADSTPKVQFGVCPFDLVEWSNGACDINGNPISFTMPLNGKARWAILSTHTHDPNQQISYYLNGAEKPAGSFQALVANKTATQVIDFGQFPTTVKFLAEQPVPDPGGMSGRRFSRIGHVEFLATNPGTNLAAGAPNGGTTSDAAAAYAIANQGPGFTATAFGTGGNPQGMFDSMDYTDNGGPIWRANENAVENYVGVVFNEVVAVEALRISVTEGLDTYRWLNFDVQVQVTVGGGWETIGRADQVLSEDGKLWTDQVNKVDTRYLWIAMDGMEIAGVRLYGADDGESIGNNPRDMGGRFLAELQVWSGPPVPEPAAMTLLALGGLAMLRRRK